MTAFTPGPWHWSTIDDDQANEDEPYHFIQIEKNSGWRGEDYMSVSGVCSEANARLIAAAPDLLEALQEVMGWISNWNPNFEHDDEWPETRARVGAAIAKARGETP